MCSSDLTLILRQPVSFDQRWSKQDLSLVLSLSISFFVSYHEELENVLESSRKRKKEKSRKRESWIKKKRDRFWNLVEKEKEVEKKGRIEIGVGMHV